LNSSIAAIEKNKANGTMQRIGDLTIFFPEKLVFGTKDAMKITRLLKNNPRELSEADAINIYENTF
jgi:alcohol dehydrogenase class IV